MNKFTRKMFVVASASLFMILMSAVYAEDTTPGVNRADDADLYRIQIGDRLEISVYGKPELTKIVTVNNYGIFSYNYISTIYALGKTIPELEKDATQRMDKIFKRSQVIVTPHQLRSQSYMIVGSINNPGRKSIQSSTTLLAAIAGAGGLQMSTSSLTTSQLTDLKRSFILRDGNYLPVDFNRLITHGDMTQNIKLKSGDFIFLPHNKAKRIYILGQVGAPRFIVLQSRMTLLQAVSHAQGLTSRASKTVLILRGTLSEPRAIKVSYDAIISGEIKDVYLRTNDIVYVPERDFIFGEELLLGAVNTFVLRMASQAGSETFSEVQSNTLDNDNNFLLNQNRSQPQAPPPTQPITP